MNKMAFAKKNKEKYTLLEELYDNAAVAGSANGAIKEFFNDSQKVENLLSISIVGVGLAALLLGFFQLHGDISLSRYRNLLAAGETATASSTDETGGTDLLGLKNKDTDADTLSDYDEINVYHTSPYLKDTDSDGTDDKTEIARSTDPNCNDKQGNCFANWSNTGNSIASLDQSTVQPDSSAYSNDPLYTGSGTSTDATIFPSQTTAADDQSQLANAILSGQISSASQIRDLLKQNGMSDNELNSLTDSELVSLYQQIAAQNSATTDSTSLSLADFKSMTPAQIRQVLAANAGISEEMLAKISDEDLMALVKETLNSQGVSQAATVAQTSSATSADLDQIKNMTPTQIRQLLAQSGVSTDILDKTSDANLMALVSQTLTSISNSTQ